MHLLLPLLLVGCKAGQWCERFNLACELGGEEEREEPLDSDGDVWIDTEDCAPTNPDIYPSAEELCDGIDNNCNGVADEGTPGEQTWYADEDGDGYGDPETAEEDCYQVGDYILEGGDCNDEYYYQNPGRSEVCNNDLDDDCDGTAAGCHLVGDYETDQANQHIVADTAGAELGSMLLVTPPMAGASELPDLWIAAPDLSLDGSPPLAQSGAVFGFQGLDFPLNGNGTYTISWAGLWSPGDSSDGHLGSAMAGGVDLDGDQAWDLAVGAPGAGEDGSGRALLYLLSPRSFGILQDDRATAIFEGSAPGQALGSSLGLSLSVDEAGTAALVVGMPGAGSGDGEVALFLGSLEGELQPEDAAWSLQGGDGSALGSVLDLGDLDGDGLEDLVLAAPDLDQGRIWVHFAPFPTGSGPVEEAGATLVGEAAGDRAGAALAAGEDVDGDGRGDLVIGGPGSDKEAEDAGSAWLLLGGQGIDRNTGYASLELADSRFDGVEEDGLAGSSVAIAGDCDGDGDGDMLFGAPGILEDRGQVYLVAGGLLSSRLLSSSTATWTGVEAGARAGEAVAFLPDVDRNGLDEVVIGAPGDDQGGRVSIHRPEPM